MGNYILLVCKLLSQLPRT